MKEKLIEVVFKECKECKQSAPIGIVLLHDKNYSKDISTWEKRTHCKNCDELPTWDERFNEKFHVFLSPSNVKGDLAEMFHTPDKEGFMSPRVSEVKAFFRETLNFRTQECIDVVEEAVKFNSSATATWNDARERVLEALHELKDR